MLLGEISTTRKDIFISDIFYVIKFHFGRENKDASICLWTLGNSEREKVLGWKLKHYQDIFRVFFHSGSSWWSLYHPSRVQYFFLPIWDVLQKSFLSFCRRWNLVLFSFSRFSFWNLVFFHRSYLTALQGLFLFADIIFIFAEDLPDPVWCSFWKKWFFFAKDLPDPVWCSFWRKKAFFFCKRSTWQEPRALRLAFLWPDSPAAINWLINW